MSDPDQNIRDSELGQQEEVGGETSTFDDSKIADPFGLLKKRPLSTASFLKKKPRPRDIIKKLKKQRGVRNDNFVRHASQRHLREEQLQEVCATGEAIKTQDKSLITMDSDQYLINYRYGVKEVDSFSAYNMAKSTSDQNL